MARLVESFLAGEGGRKPIEHCYEELREAHHYLARNATSALYEAAALQPDERWGAGVKRMQVSLPDKHRSGLIGRGLTAHNLGEVTNQCATIERLLDALLWASREPRLEGYEVERCHPTTGSAKGGPYDNDLVLVREGASSPAALFEVSDVASSKDGNNKEKRDLANLGILRKKSFEPVYEWPDATLFLVVSEEFVGWLQRRRNEPVSYHYEEMRQAEGNTAETSPAATTAAGSTRILEIKPGVAP